MKSMRYQNYTCFSDYKVSVTEFTRAFQQ